MSLPAPRHWLNKAPLWLLKCIFSLWPPFLGTGISIKKISPDYRHIEITMQLRWYNKNYIGSHFGGSMFSMTDPFYMLMLIKNMGNDYIILDKAGYINFKKPGYGKLRAIFNLSAEEIQSIRDNASQHEKYLFEKPVDILNEENMVVASVMRTIYVRRKER